MGTVSSTHTVHRHRSIRLLLLTLSVWIISYQSLRIFLNTTHTHTHTTDTHPTQPKPLLSSPTSSANPTNDTSPPLLRTIGILTDVQYAPVPDGTSFDGVPRYYRRALDVTRIAAMDFETRGVDLVVNLGDSIDGRCRDSNRMDGDGTNTNTKHEHTRRSKTRNDNHKRQSSTEDCLNDFLRALSPYRSGPILHTYGNHDLYNFDRETIQQKLGIPYVNESENSGDDGGGGDLVGYYTRLLPVTPTLPNTNRNHSHSHSHNAVQRRIRIVVLDVYDVSVLQRQPPIHHHHHPSSKFQRATNILKTHNPNNFFTNPNSSNGLTSFNRRYVAYNGAIDNPQLLWLSQTLSNARSNREMVLILSHVPIHPLSAEREPESLVWNYKEILEILRKDGRGVIAMVLQGHIHKGGYGRDDISGIHFRGFQSVIEGKDPTYGYLEVYGDRLEVKGVGNCESGVYDLKHLEV